LNGSVKEADLPIQHKSIVDIISPEVGRLPDISPHLECGPQGSAAKPKTYGFRGELAREDDLLRSWLK